MNKYSVAVVGGGPGDYVTAIRLKQYNIDVAVFEKERLGGVCLNHGCIPTKALVKNADLVFHLAAAVGTRCVAIFSGMDYEGQWHPYEDIPGFHIIIRYKLEVC
jgi:dihydrolipoamide dehydrogenase